MRRIVAVITTLSLFITLFAQERDSIKQINLELEEIAITATQTLRSISEIPAQIDVISSSVIENFPFNNIDDLLRISSNINVNRSWGIFSKNSSVTMRGLEGSDRILVLVDGVPKNKLGGGSVNWHNINPAVIDRIEVIKGPASSLYGNNAMGGVINIITKKPVEAIEGEVNTFIGSYGTRGGLLDFSGKTGKEKDKGLYWDINGFYRKGDGYIFEPPEFLDQTDVPTYLNEFGGGGMLGYQFSKDNSLDISYDYFDETRGAGRKVYMEDGSFEAYQTNQLKTKYSGRIAGGSLSAIVYYNYENYYGQKESLNDYNEYRLLDSYSEKGDLGFQARFSRDILRNNNLTIGIEGKSGSLEGEEVYRTSPDLIEYNSNMDIAGLYIQDEIAVFQARLKFIGGLRADYVNFRGGSQSVNDPTSVTGFQNSFHEVFSGNSWTALSPKLAIQYGINQRTRIYVSYGSGFMPPGLKDLAQTGKIRKGFRLANPDLRPEYLSNYELGYKGLIGNKISISSALYYSRGRDFQYMINTGDSIDTGGSSLKPIMMPDNIARVAIIGAEVSAALYLNKWLIINTGYSYNNSKIIEYLDDTKDPDRSLAGNYLAEVSPHIFYTNLKYRNKHFDFNFNTSYVSGQWYDDENTIEVDDYFLMNLRLSKNIFERFNFYVDVQNLLNLEYIDRKGKLSPGRYIVVGMKLTLQKVKSYW